MIEVVLSDQEMHWAREKALTFVRPQEHVSELERKDTILLGYMGEAAFLSAFPGSEHVDARGYDILFRGKPIEIKCKGSDFSPRLTGHVMIRNTALERARGFIVFCQASVRQKKVWILGFMIPNEIPEIGRLTYPGEPMWDGGPLLRGNGPVYMMQIGDLREFRRRF